MRTLWVSTTLAVAMACGCGSDASTSASASASAASASSKPSTSSDAKPAKSAEPAPAKSDDAKPADAKPPTGGIAGAPGEAGAKALLATLKSGDAAKLTASLKPSEDDLKAIFDDSVVGALKEHVEKMYGEPEMAKGIVIKDDPSELHCFSADDIKGWAKAVSDELPGGYQRVGPKLKPGVTICKFKSGGSSYDGLTFVSGKWFLVPKPFHAIKKD